MLKRKQSQWKPSLLITPVIWFYFVSQLHLARFFFPLSFLFEVQLCGSHGWQFARRVKGFAQVNRGRRERKVCTVRKETSVTASLPASSWNRLTVCKDPVLFWRLWREEEEHSWIFEELQAGNKKETTHKKTSLEVCHKIIKTPHTDSIIIVAVIKIITTITTIFIMCVFLRTDAVRLDIFPRVCRILLALSLTVAVQ